MLTFCGKLLAGGLASGGFTGGLLRACHSDNQNYNKNSQSRAAALYLSKTKRHFWAPEKVETALQLEIHVYSKKFQIKHQFQNSHRLIL